GWHPKAPTDTSAYGAVVVRTHRGRFGSRVVREDAIAEEPCNAKEFVGAPAWRLKGDLGDQVGSEVGGVIRHVPQRGSAGRVVQAAGVTRRTEDEVGGSIVASKLQS